MSAASAAAFAAASMASSDLRVRRATRRRCPRREPRLSQQVRFRWLGVQPSAAASRCERRGRLPGWPRGPRRREARVPGLPEDSRAEPPVVVAGRCRRPRRDRSERGRRRPPAAGRGPRRGCLHASVFTAASCDFAAVFALVASSSALSSFNFARSLSLAPCTRAFAASGAWPTRAHS